jgi:hypothetical protein
MVSEPVPNPSLEHTLREPGTSTRVEVVEFTSAVAVQKADATPASDRMKEGYRQVRVLVERARIRMRQIKNNYPVHVVASIAGAAFVAGLFVRMWRNHDV